MKVDVSEIKTFKTCKRQWQLSSRNKFHLRPKVPSANLTLGTLFHEALAQLYLGVPLDKVMEMIRKEMSDDEEAALLAMIPGYYNNVLMDDLDRFKVLDVEWHFEYAPTASDGSYLFPLEPMKDGNGNTVYDEDGNPVIVSSLVIVGSIDMVVLDVEQNKIYGFEHKTCKSFRDEAYLWMDEQPRVYTWALQQFVDRYNARTWKKWQEDWEAWDRNCQEPDQEPVKPTPVTLGGVYLNEVKKLLRQFQYKRTLCTYSKDDLDNFMRSFFGTCSHCKHMVDNNEYAAPQPGYMSCSMCSFKTICSTYMYENINKNELLEEFSEEFEERTEDHLEEKTEREGQNS